MDNLTIFGAVVGAIDVCSKIYQSVDPVISQVKNAPDVARDVLSEVRLMQTTLKSFHDILETKPTIPKSASSKLSVGALTDVVEDCVRTLDLLRETVKTLSDPDQGRLALYERFQWALNEKKVAKQLERLHRVQTCTHSIVVLCTEHAINEAAAAVSNLNTNLSKVRTDLPPRPPSVQGKEKNASASHLPISDCPRLPEFDFEAALRESTVYRLAQGSECVSSTDCSIANGGAWSLHGSDIPPVISVIALPLTKSELVNPEFYPFSPRLESQIPSRRISHPTVDVLHDLAIARPTFAAAPSTSDTLQSLTTSALTTSDKRSFSVECESRGPKARNGTVICMGSLFFNQNTQIWPSASEIGAQLSICASNGLLDDFMCSYCNSSLGAIVQARRDYWTEYSVFCRPCGLQLKALHGSAFCPCKTPVPKLYVKYYNFSSSMSLVRCTTCFSCCFGCSRPHLIPKNKCQTTPAEPRIKQSGITHSRSRTGLNAHHSSTSEDSTGSSATAITSNTVITSKTSPTPHRLHKRPPPYLPLLPTPPISPLDDAIPEGDEIGKQISIPPQMTALGQEVARGLETPPDSAQNTSHSESEGELPAEKEKAAVASLPPGHKPSGSRDYIMRIPDDICDALMLRKSHKTSSSISKVYFKDKNSVEHKTQDINPPLYWRGRLLFHHDAGPCLKLLYNIPRQLQDKYRKGQFALAGTRGLLDPFKCKACQRDIWNILGKSTAPDRYLSYFMWCGRTDKCTAVDTKKCWTCACHQRDPLGKLHIGYLDAVTGMIVAFCSDCFEMCRDCRANGNMRAELHSQHQPMQRSITA